MEPNRLTGEARPNVSAGGPSTVRPTKGPAVGCLPAAVGALVVLGAAVVLLALLRGQVSTIPSTAGASVTSTQPSSPAASATLMASPTPDAAKIADLMATVEANPTDATSLLALADEYFRVGDYATASDWAKRVVAADAKNVEGYVALGAAQYNLGDETAAETAWEQAIVLDPRDVEAHYDLGFLYFAKQPQDTAGAIREWRAVVALDPGSDLATAVQAHLDAMTGSPRP